jgi:hypothetical protein
MSTNSFPALRTPIIDLKTGQMDWTWIQWFVDAQNRLQNGLNQLGELIGQIKATTIITGRTEGIGTTVQHIDDTGVMTPEGMTSATSKAQGAVILPSGALSNTLGSASIKEETDFDSSGAAAAALKTAETYTDTVAETTLAAAEAFSSDASNITIGNLAIARMPAAGLSVTITTAALTSSGSSGSMTFTNGILTASTQAT